MSKNISDKDYNLLVSVLGKDVADHVVSASVSAGNTLEKAGIEFKSALLDLDKGGDTPTDGAAKSTSTAPEVGDVVAKAMAEGYVALAKSFTAALEAYADSTQDHANQVDILKSHVESIAQKVDRFMLTTLSVLNVKTRASHDDSTALDLSLLAELQKQVDSEEGQRKQHQEGTKVPIITKMMSFGDMANPNNVGGISDPLAGMGASGKNGNTPASDNGKLD